MKAHCLIKRSIQAVKVHPSGGDNNGKNIKNLKMALKK
jgi:hypothetical protein